jgi:hypothetical protein
MWTYSQSTGAIANAKGEVIAHGYSGYLQGKNNPALQGVRNLGPIPVGKWRMANVINSPHTGPFTIILEPASNTETFGRSAFRIHGDSIKDPGSASHGCIIAPRPTRETMWHSQDREVEVVP